jgi:hypothetical protein
MVNAEFDVAEITPTDVWEKTKCQLFKVVDGSSWETYIVKDQKAIHVGNGGGGFGVTSVMPYDINSDGNVDLVYAYSYGSGIHRSPILCSYFMV